MRGALDVHSTVDLPPSTAVQSDMTCPSRDSSGGDVVPEDRHAWSVRVHTRFQSLSPLQREQLLGGHVHSVRGLFSASTEPYRPHRHSHEEIMAIVRSLQLTLNVTASIADHSSRLMADVDDRLARIEQLLESVFGLSGTGANHVFRFRDLGAELEVIRDAVLPAISQRLDDLEVHSG